MFSKFKNTCEASQASFFNASGAAMAHLKVMGGQLTLIAKACLTYLKGDLDLVLNHTALKHLAAAAAKADDGKASIRIGSPLLGRNIVYVNPVLSAEQNESFLRKLMNMPDKEARDPYQIFCEVLGSSFFIGDNSEQGMFFHRKIKRYLSFETFDQEAIDNMMDLYQASSSGIVNTEIYPVLVRRNLRDFFARKLLGFDLGEALSDFFDLIETKMVHYHLYPALYLKYNSPVAKMRQEYLRLLARLFNNHIKTLDEQLNNGFHGTTKTLLADIIQEKYPGIDEPLDAEKLIEWLVNEPEVQMCVAGMFAVSNIADLIVHAIQNLLNKMEYQSKFHLKTITKELVEQRLDLSDCHTLRGSQSLPALNEFYLMNLRQNPPLNYVCRYSRNEFKTEGMDIPANSVIFYKFKNAGSMLEDVSHTSLHRGYLTPFGLGKRMCPAVNVSELVFKFYVGSFVMLYAGIQSDLALQVDKNEAEEERQSDEASPSFEATVRGPNALSSPMRLRRH